MLDSSQNKDNDYSFLKKMEIIIFWVQVLKYDNDLKANGHFKKYKSRRICILLGVLFYAIVIAMANIFK